MIPPVEERAVRPCDECIFYDDYWKCEYPRGFIDRSDNPCPCPHHMNVNEIVELIDSGGV